MTRILVVLVVAGLIVAPAAVAKGPHAILTSGPDPVEAGRAVGGDGRAERVPRHARARA